MRALLILLIFFSITSNAQVIDLQHQSPVVNIGKSVRYFEDKKAALSFTDVQQIYGDGGFKKGTTDILNFGNVPSAIWIHIDIHSASDGVHYLVLDASSLEAIDYFMPADTGWRSLQAGSIRTPSAGVKSTNHYIFPVPANNTETTALWLRIKTRNIMIVPIKIVSADGLFVLENSIFKIIEIGLIGAFLALFAFHLFLFFGIWDRSYLYYCLYTLSFGFYVIGYLAGYAYLLGTDMRILLNKYPHVFLCLALVSSILITQKVYKLREISPSLFRLCNSMLVATVVLLIISLLGLKPVAAGGAQLLGLLVPLTLLICGIVINRTSGQPTIYFTIAWFSIIATAIIYVLSLQGIFEYRANSRLILEGGLMLEFLLLAFALGKRYHSILIAQRQIEEENYQLVKDQNEKLEKLVEKRTEALRHTILKLETSDKIKNKMFSIVAHDLRTPFNGILGLFSSGAINELSYDELKLVIGESKENFYELKNLLDNLLHWARVQMNEVQIVPVPFDLPAMITALAGVYKPVAARKSIQLEIKTAPDLKPVKADKNHILVVLRNLFDNAIKFSPPENVIYITLSKMGTHVQISIENRTDAGAVEKINSWMDGQQFTASYGTANEKGVGLGLSLCSDYLEKNGSRLEITNLQTSIRFSFELLISGGSE